MNYRIVVLLFAVLSVLTSSANKSTGYLKSGPLTQPDDLECPDRDASKNDSVEYFIKHARLRESWAYEALAEIYRYGKHGVDKSMANALMYYDAAGMSAGKLAAAAYDSDPNDEFGFINHLMEGLGKDRLSDTEIISEIDNMRSPAPVWASFLKEILQCDSDDRKDFIESRLRSEMTPDELLIGFGCLAMIEPDAFERNIFGTEDDYMESVRACGDRIPILYAVAGDKLWRKYYPGEGNNSEHIANALECMYQADRAGFLSYMDMRRILDYCELYGNDENILFSDEDLARFEKLSPSKSRDNMDESVIEEVVVEEGAEVIDE